MSVPASAGFDDLQRELDLWAAAGCVAAFWWRDDDAAEPTPALARLTALSADFSIELALAAIPALAVPALADAAAGGSVVIVQHGYSHANRARLGEPAIECGGDRETFVILSELDRGRRRMVSLFGERFVPVLAAPWNRIERRVLKRLAEIGISGVSAYGPRVAMEEVAGLPVANAHVDPMNWRERRFAGTGKALSSVVGELRARRLVACDPGEPIGLLTHHLDHDPEFWTFLEDFLGRTRRHPAARWVGVEEAFGLPARAIPRVAEGG